MVFINLSVFFPKTKTFQKVNGCIIKNAGQVENNMQGAFP